MNKIKVGRNELCPCGSIKKYKQCCQKINVTTEMPAVADQIHHALKAAWAVRQQGNLSQAENICHQIIQIDARNSEALNLLGVLMMQDGRVDLATNYFKSATAITPKNPEFHSNLGLALHEQGDLNGAEKQYRKAIALKNDYVDAYYNLHAVLLNNDHFNEAIKCLKKVVEFQPHDYDARYMLGVLLEYTGNNKAAVEELDIVAKTTDLMKARLDAWTYLKSENKKLPVITGSGDQIFRLALSHANSKGLVLEFGVRFATSIRQIAKMISEPIHGFDSFEGLPEVWHHEPKGSYTTKGVVPEVPSNVTLHAGWFEDTLPKFLETNKDTVRFINIDCDIYSSTVTILENLAPRIIVGSVIVFDEYIGNEKWREDEYKAFQEAVRKYGWTYEYIAFSVFTKQVAVIITKI